LLGFVWRGPLQLGEKRRRSGRWSVKYVVAWQQRENVTEAVQARSLEVFSRWSPDEGTTFLQFVSRIDSQGGFAVVETDDATLIARDMAIFGAFFEMSVYPVLDVQEGASISAAAIAFLQSGA
jgi:hypothetical protein